MAEERHASPAEQIKNLYEGSETRTAEAFEQLVKRDSFGELLARMTENVVGVTKIATDTFDLILRNLRLAGRQDITRLARQLARAEDKLELVLQEVEGLRQEVQSKPSWRWRRSSSTNGRARKESARRPQSARRRDGGSARRVGDPRQPSAAPEANRGRGGGDDQDSQ